MDKDFVWSSIYALRDAFAANTTQFKLGYTAKVRCPTTFNVDTYQLELFPDHPVLRHWVKLPSK